MTSCKYVKENLSAYYDNELSADVRQIIEQHLSVCHDCSTELDEIAQIAQICADLTECDLPDRFRDELHEKLVAAAGEKTVINTERKKHSAIFRSKAFLSAAAGILLIFLVGSFYKMGLFSPKAVTEAAMAAPSAMSSGVSADRGESYAMSQAPEAEQDNDNTMSEAPKAESKENLNIETKESKEANTERVLKSFAMANGAEGGNETDRSSTSSQSMIMDFEVQSAEIISNKSSSITITYKDTEYVLETINTTAIENGSTAVDEQGEEEPVSEGMTFSIASASEQSVQKNVDRQELSFLIPVDKYDSFISELTGILGESNVQVGAYVTEDMTGTLEKLRSQLDEINTSIEQLDNSKERDSKAKVDQLEKERCDIESQIEQITVESDYISVSIFVYNE